MPQLHPSDEAAVRIDVGVDMNALRRLIDAEQL
jgi:hypothetical protein